MIARRELLTAMVAMTALILPGYKLEARNLEEVFPEYGLIGQIVALPGRRADLIAIIKRSPEEMPGNMGYLVGEDATNPDAIWIVEVWQTREHHRAALGLSHVRAAIEQARPLIAGFGARHEFVPA